MKVIVIGNGSSTKDFKFGEKIDSEFDVVVRFNRGYFEGVNNYEEYIGTRTDILIIHDGFAKPDYLTNEVLSSVDTILVVVPAFKMSNEIKRIESYGWGEKVQIIPIEYELKLNSMVDFGDKWPTTGLVGLYIIASSYDDVTMFGFDGGNVKYKYYHYFSETDKRTSKHMNRSNRIDHDFSAEVECINTIRDKFKLKELNEEY